MVVAFDFLDSMAWSVAASAILLTIGAFRLIFNKKDKDDSVKTGKVNTGFALGLGANGVYLFITGAMISVMWPFEISSGVYNVLFGGVASLGGLILIAVSIALFRNIDLAPISYFAAVVGIYSAVEAYAIVTYGLTRTPWLSVLAYLSFAAPAVLSVPAGFFRGKRSRMLFAASALLFAAVWLVLASQFTLEHLQP
jgi:uncharacterized membrane protein